MIALGDLITQKLEQLKTGQLELIPPSQLRKLRRTAAQQARRERARIREAARDARAAGAHAAARRLEAAAVPARGSHEWPNVLRRLEEVLRKAARPFHAPRTTSFDKVERAREFFNRDRQEAIDHALELVGQLTLWLAEEQPATA